MGQAQRTATCSHSTCAHDEPNHHKVSCPSAGFEMQARSQPDQLQPAAIAREHSMRPFPRFSHILPAAGLEVPARGLAHRNLQPQHFLVKEVEEGVPAQLKLAGLGHSSSLTPGKLPQSQLQMPSQNGPTLLPAGRGCIHRLSCRRAASARHCRLSCPARASAEAQGVPSGLQVPQGAQPSGVSCRC